MLDRAGETGKDEVLEMTLTIHNGHNGKYVIVGTEDKRFGEYPLASRRGWNNNYYAVDIDSKRIYKDLVDIASFVNNELGEDCMFAIE